MKSIIALSLSLLLTSTAFAEPVATIVTSGGFMPVPTTTTVSLNADGTVTLETVRRPWDQSTPAEVKKVEVAKVNPSIVAAIVKDVAEANNTTLVQEDPEAPECMDAPFVAYSVVKDGKLVRISTTHNCKSSFLDDYQGRNAVYLLNSFRALAQYSK